MELTVRAATTAELPELMQLYTNARAFCRPTATLPNGTQATPVKPAWPLKSSAASAMW